MPNIDLTAIRDNAIPLLEAIGWTDIGILEHFVYGIDPSGTQRPVPDKLINLLAERKFHKACECPRVMGLVIRENGEAVRAWHDWGWDAWLRDEGTAESSYHVITDVVEWLPLWVEGIDAPVS